ncbi:GIY-YIG nuclease family protein [Pseudoalteromonas aurantia]|uniref:GIY-YIG domain-containing protein n=1 Tax=Pseudoalteromonas aurantia 208 TaxID=1314867 RepID=A0ABR9EI87_9GAMM|nr:GIY-YIG nuclease family protein [Pseudoalteromonas aurantia]MBE0370644.1 hypothetical protein [Pseudoalteromonas aurantia 208]
MELFTFLNALDKDLIAKNTKIHLAVNNGDENPLDMYFADRFDAWQAVQNKQNFNRHYIVALIQLPESNTWLFIGAYRVIANRWANDHYVYTTEKLKGTSDYAGRLKVAFQRTGRQSYLLAENWCDDMTVHTLMPERLAVEHFKGYQFTKLSKAHLDIIVKQQVQSWKTALESVSGVYLITDLASGKHYVGSATGCEGIWQRWCDYSKHGHGYNERLIEVLEVHGPDYAHHFQFSILEIADTHMTADYIRTREAHWKDILGSRVFGYNGN